MRIVGVPRNAWSRWIGGRPAARAVALFTGLNLTMIVLYGALFAALAALQRDASSGVLAALAAAIGAGLSGAALYAAILHALRPGRRTVAEVAVLGVLGMAAVWVATVWLRMPFLTLAVVPIVARYWLSLERTLGVAAVLVAWSVAWFAVGSPQPFSAALAASVAGGVVAVVFGGYTLLGFEFAIAQARAREQLEETTLALEASYRELRTYRDLELEHAYLAERARISRELHDTLGHHLTAQRFDLQVLGKLVRESEASAAALRALDRNAEAMADVRRALHATRPERLERLGCSRAVRELVAAAAGSPDVRFDVEGEEGHVSPDAALAVYRLAQEAITNVAKHAPGRALDLRVAFEPGAVRVTAANDVDTDPADRELVHGNGLRGIEERMVQLGGSVRVARRGGRFELDARLPR